MNACICCEAALLCASGAAKFYVRTMDVVYIYVGENGIESVSASIILEGEELLQCWKMQTLFDGGDISDPYVHSLLNGVSGNVNEARLRRSQRHCESPAASEP